MTAYENLIAIIGNKVFGKEAEISDDCDTAEMCRIAKAHDMAHYLADVITDEKFSPLCKREKDIAVFREIKLNLLYQKTKTVLENAKIAYVPLKGAIIREMYPEKWMRTSCDVDILIHKSDIDKAVKLLCDCGFKTDGVKNYHDVTLSYGGMTLELHFSINEVSSQVDKLLKKVWNYTEKISDYEYRETSAYFAFHHIAHMSYHFIAGGCGIKPFVDLYLLKTKSFYSEDELIPLLKKCDLIPFYNAVCELMTVWFEQKPHTELTKQMENYIIYGGVYGTDENKDAIARTKDGKLSRIIKIAFPPFEKMCELYPSISDRKYLLPIYYLKRCFDKIIGKESKQARNSAKSIIGKDTKKMKDVKEFINKLQLK